MVLEAGGAVMLLLNYLDTVLLGLFTSLGCLQALGPGINTNFVRVCANVESIREQ